MEKIESNPITGEFNATGTPIIGKEVNEAITPGMAAALPGVIASLTTVPTIGVPVALNSPVMGFDSIFSILQMPPGVPVATVAVNGGQNAALLAVEILALNDRDLSNKIKSFRETQKQKVRAKDQQFQSS